MVKNKSLKTGGEYKFVQLFFLHSFLLIRWKYQMQTFYILDYKITFLIFCQFMGLIKCPILA